MKKIKWLDSNPDVISLRLRFQRNFLSVLHPNLVSSPIKGISANMYTSDSGVVHEFSKMAVSLKWILDYFVGYTL
jgi:hypothetical protein